MAHTNTTAHTDTYDSDNLDIIKNNAYYREKRVINREIK